MGKKKKIILISIISVIIVLIIIGIVAVVSGNNKKENTSKVMKLYNTLKEKDEYGFLMKSNEDNEIYYAKKDGKAYIRTNYEGNIIENIIKEGNTYLLQKDEKCYYTYRNNEINLNKIEINLKELDGVENTKGKEKIDGQNYEYEEYKKVIPLTMLDTIDNFEDYSMRFYFKGQDLKYIKTFKDDKKELLKIEISNNVDSKLFEIPSNFEEK